MRIEDMGGVRRVLVAALIATGLAQAGPLVYSTGLGAPGLPDQHYTMIYFPGVYPEDIPTDLASFGALPAYRLLPGGLPNSPWMAYAAPVHWIAPQNNYGWYGADPWGTYVFRTTFDLTGYDPSTALIQGAWSSDNCGHDIRINGYSTGSWGMVAPNCLAATHEFSIGPTITVQETIGGSSTYSQVMPFVAGVNTLEFVFQNAYCPTCTQNPAGLSVEITHTYAYAVPEPDVWALASVGMLLLFVRMRHLKYAARQR